jgi:hypothetical protein
MDCKLLASAGCKGLCPLYRYVFSICSNGMYVCMYSTCKHLPSSSSQTTWQEKHIIGDPKVSFIERKKGIYAIENRLKQIWIGHRKIHNTKILTTVASRPSFLSLPILEIKVLFFLLYQISFDSLRTKNITYSLTYNIKMFFGSLMIVSNTRKSTVKMPNK